ncbi:Uncharacterised protein [Mycobacteroides abscessus subsp. abscessus]|nr:Uncharacterised protein [Mycobacteroides abscessus subsp. abscessus]
MSGQHDGTSFGAQQPDGIPNLLFTFDIQPAGGLVEEQHLRVVGNGQRDIDAAPHTAGQRTHLAVDVGAQAELLDELVLTRLPARLGPARDGQTHPDLLDR